MADTKDDEMSSNAVNQNEDNLTESKNDESKLNEIPVETPGRRSARRRAPPGRFVPIIPVVSQHHHLVIRIVLSLPYEYELKQTPPFFVYINKLKIFIGIYLLF